jgi:hypothetical protein
VLIVEPDIFLPSSTHNRVGYVENYSRLLITLAYLRFLSTFELVSTFFSREGGHGGHARACPGMLNWNSRARARAIPTKNRSQQRRYLRKGRCSFFITNMGVSCPGGSLGGGGRGNSLEDILSCLLLNRKKPTPVHKQYPETALDVQPKVLNRS